MVSAADGGGDNCYACVHTAGGRRAGGRRRRLPVVYVGAVDGTFTLENGAEGEGRREVGEGIECYFSLRP